MAVTRTISGNLPQGTIKADDLSLSIDELKDRKPFPCIIQWNYHHFVVLTGIRGKYVYINDPGKGTVRYPMQVLERSYKGVAMTFSPTGSFEKGGSKPSSLRFVLKRMKGLKSGIAAVLVTSALASIATVLFTTSGKAVVDYYITGSETSSPVGFVLALFGLCVIYGVMQIIRSIYMVRLQGRSAVVDSSRFAGAEDRAFYKWADRFSKYAEAAFNRPKYLYCMDAFVVLIGMLGTLSIYIKAMDTGYSTADFMAFNTAFGQINAAIVLFTGMISQMVLAYPKFGLLSPILKAVPECDDDKPSVEDVEGSVEVNHLSFRYSDDTPIVLDDISFRIEAGEYVAIVGKSGCGKSTLMRLLLGFEQPSAGNIMYGEYDLSRVNLRSIRQNGISMVMQDAKLLKGDIYDNITLANPNATIEDAWEAAEMAGIAKDIREMPLGMNTLVSEGGGGVSGGQRQRLIIARAVCSRRKIMILDEATSALDNITQQAVTESLAKLKCTRIAIAHRLSTVQHCDRILVLDKGKICEEGTYEELIQKNGVFAELVRKQRLDME